MKNLAQMEQYAHKKIFYTLAERQTNARTIDNIRTEETHEIEPRNNPTKF